MSKNQTISIKDVSPTANKQRPRKEQRDAAQSFISTIQGINFPNSKRIYITGTRSDIQVPMREIQLDKTLIGGSKEDPILKRMNLFQSMTLQGLMVIQLLNLTLILA